MEMPDKLVFAQDLLKSCFVPDLHKDLDSVPIEADSFENYRQVLQGQLPVLYDFVEQNKHWIFFNKDQETEEVYACLIVLLSEVTAPGTVYNLKNEELLRNANRLLKRYSRISESVDRIIFDHYQNKLSKTSWKRHLGSVHGLVRFLDMRYNEGAKSVPRMSTQWLNFCLAVGFTIRECHEPRYKQLGIQVFKMILKNATGEDIKSLNIHEVIYDTVVKDVHCVDSVATTADVWSCLYKCLDYYTAMDSFTWNCADDMMEVLLRNLSLPSNNLVSLCLLKFVTKLGCYFAINQRDIEAKCNADFGVPSALEKCRNTCFENTSYTPFRWAKSILHMLNAESYKLINNPGITQQLLREIHRCYMVCILPIPLQISEIHLLEFLHKLIPVLLEVVVSMSQGDVIVKDVQGVLYTIYIHLKQSFYCEESVKLLNFRKALQKLLTQSFFN